MARDLLDPQQSNRNSPTDSAEDPKIKAGHGHGFEYYNRQAEKALDLIAQRLESERLRV